MITIMTTHNDETPLDVLATECDYEVIISEIDGVVNSALCEGETAGEQAREVVDKYRLLGDDSIPFPSTITAIHQYLVPYINRIGL